MMVTAFPPAANRASVPPQPLSGSSGCPPTQTIFSFLSDLEFADRITGNERRPIPAAAFFTKRRREVEFFIYGSSGNQRKLADISNPGNVKNQNEKNGYPYN